VGKTLKEDQIIYLFLIYVEHESEKFKRTLPLTRAKKKKRMK